MKTLVDELILGQSSLQSTIEDYIGAQAVIQTIISPSGALSNGSGLGEPKFEINETAFKGSWGRPQRDGPALRAITLMSYIDWLLDNGGADEAQNIIWPIVRSLTNDHDPNIDTCFLDCQRSCVCRSILEPDRLRSVGGSFGRSYKLQVE